MSLRCCEICFHKFHPSRANHWHCSVRCRVRDHRKDKKIGQPETVELQCEVCPQTFKPERETQRFCSRPCQVKGNTLRVKARKLKDEWRWGIARIAGELGVTPKIVRLWLK